MKVAALISGGKDSCYNMMTCIAEGHNIVALANLRPENKDELDSYMYQTVGHHAIDLYAEATGLPLYTRTIQGASLSIGPDYQPHEGDEVEDLFQLLSQIKSEMEIEAVSVGAILSDYQRVRVENVCQRLGLRVLAFLWRRNQRALLKEMIDSGLKAIIIKVAAMGLSPDQHLGMELKDIFPHMVEMSAKYGLNECGEGGEYETFVFDCPIFKKSILIEEKELVIHSKDAFAPVGYLNLRKCSLQDKPGHDVSSFVNDVDNSPVSTTTKWLAKQLGCAGDDSDGNTSSTPTTDTPCLSALAEEEHEAEYPPICRNDGNNFQVSGIMAVTNSTTSDVSQAALTAMDSLKGCIQKLGHELSDVTSLSLYVGSMSNYADINSIYKTYFEVNPPTRICIQLCLPPNVLFQLDCEGSRTDKDMSDRRTMYVQSLSLWAPANLGPFSQSILLNRKIYASGTTALVPSTLKLIGGGVGVQTRVALTHLMEKFHGLWSCCTVGNCPLMNCYITRREHIPVVRKEFELFLQRSPSSSLSLTPSIQYCVVPRLPQGALVEWQAYAWMFTDCEEEDEIGVSEKTKNFPDWSCKLDCVWFKEHVCCRIEVCSKSPSRVDPKEMASVLMHEYSTAMTKRNGDSCGGLTKIFYLADCFSHKQLVESFSQTLEDVDCTKIPTFSFVPVMGLDTDQHILSWSQ